VLPRRDLEPEEGKRELESGGMEAEKRYNLQHQWGKKARRRREDKTKEMMKRS
jgi:hypothetical protein